MSNKAYLPTVQTTKSCDDYVCWTRMQAEAGQALDEIIARKEIERFVGKGMFLWGVGNAPAVITTRLAKVKSPIPVIFSIMKGRPRATDVTPGRVLAWRGYVDAHGVERPLPGHSLVTSRGESASGLKKRHFALFCWSEKELKITRGVPFDPSAYRNAGGTGAPVGSSQTTALLKRTSSLLAKTDYEANIRAFLVDSYWVRLTDPIELSNAKISAISSASQVKPSKWTDFVSEIRSGPSIKAPIAQGRLL